MFKIGEFSKLTQVSIRMLRYYDEAGLLKPAKTDAWTGYRMYSAEQIPTLNKIIYLRDSGFQVSEIAAALAAENEMSLIEHLDKKYREIQENIKTEQERLQKILLVKKDILHGQNEMPYNVTIKSIPGIQVSPSEGSFRITTVKVFSGKRCQILQKQTGYRFPLKPSLFTTIRSIRRHRWM